MLSQVLSRVGLGSKHAQTVTPANAPAATRLNEIREECLSIISKTSLVSAGIAVIPVPFFDVIVDAGILTQLLPTISEKFGLSAGRTSIYSPDTKEIHWSAVKTLSFEFAGLVVTRGATRKAIQGFGTKVITKQVTKFIPLGGQMVAASIGYFAMKKIASIHLEECYQQALIASQASA